MATSIHPDEGVDAFLIIKQIAEGKWWTVDAQLRERAIEIVRRSTSREIQNK